MNLRRTDSCLIHRRGAKHPLRSCLPEFPVFPPLPLLRLCRLFRIGNVHAELRPRQRPIGGVARHVGKTGRGTGVVDEDSFSPCHAAFDVTCHTWCVLRIGENGGSDGLCGGGDAAFRFADSPTWPLPIENRLKRKDGAPQLPPRCCRSANRCKTILQLL
jgi:hypothetical protein